MLDGVSMGGEECNTASDIASNRTPLDAVVDAWDGEGGLTSASLAGRVALNTGSRLSPDSRKKRVLFFGHVRRKYQRGRSRFSGVVFWARRAVSRPAL